MPSIGLSGWKSVCVQFGEKLNQIHLVYYSTLHHVLQVWTCFVCSEIKQNLSYNWYACMQCIVLHLEGYVYNSNKMYHAETLLLLVVDGSSLLMFSVKCLWGSG